MDCVCGAVCCSEKEILHEEINSLEVVKDKLKARIAELEDEVCRTRDALSKKSSDADAAAANAEVRALCEVDFL